MEMHQTSAIMKPKLTIKEKVFCREYLKTGGNAAEAARRAGYSVKAAKELGFRLLTKDHIKLEVTRLRANVEETLQVTKERVILEHIKIAFDDDLDPRPRIFDRQRSLENISKLMGYDSPVKHQVEVEGEKAINITINGTEIDLGK